MAKLICLILLAAAAVPAQEPAAAPALRSDALAETARKAAADWETLAKGLEAKVARMLPCDPRVKTTIEEVSRASETHLVSQGQYLQAAAAEAKRDLETARSTLEAEQASAREIEVERAEADQERIAVEGQLADLIESGKKRPSLEDARNKLALIATMIRQRASELEQQTARRTALNSALADVVSALQTRQKAMDAQLAAFSIETSRWAEYYAARLARAQTECAITGPSPAQKKKQ